MRSGTLLSHRSMEEIVHVDESWELPIPGTFIIDQRGKVRLAFVDVDYTHRIEPSALLEGLRQLAGQQEA